MHNVLTGNKFGCIDMTSPQITSLNFNRNFCFKNLFIQNQFHFHIHDSIIFPIKIFFI